MIYRPGLPADLVPSKVSFPQASLLSDYSLFVLLGPGTLLQFVLPKRKQEA